MGNEGGTIPKRSEILNFAERKFEGISKAKNASSRELKLWEVAERFRCCFLSHKRLTLPILSDYKGHLFNKEAILVYLLERKKKKKKKDSKAKANNQFPYIRSISDLVELKIQYDEDSATIKCPLSGKVYNVEADNEDTIDKIHLCYFVPCGCTASKEICMETLSVELKKKKIPFSELYSKHVELKCPVCGEPFNSRDIIDINPVDDSTKKRLETRHTELQELALTHSLKHRKRKHKSDKSSNHKHRKKADE